MVEKKLHLRNILQPSFALKALEQVIRGIKATPETLQARLQEAYSRMKIQSPVDFATSIMTAITPPNTA